MTASLSDRADVEHESFTASPGASETTTPEDWDLADEAMWHWWKAVQMEREQDAVLALKQIYRASFPRQGEIIFTGACPFACQHCIYPPDYAKQNASRDWIQWVDNLMAVRDELGIDTFVYGGRSLNKSGAQLLVELRRRLPRAKIGLIDNGLSIRPHLELLKGAELDWIDISFDGMRAEHERQRGSAGCFDQAVAGLEAIKKARLAPKVNVLTCLTGINVYSVSDMIGHLNKKGVKNFFLTPVVIVDKVRPSPSVALPPAQLLNVVNELSIALPNLSDAYVEIGLFEPDDLGTVLGADACRIGEAACVADCLEWAQYVGDSEMAVRYYPASLTGLREFAINTDGVVLAPKAMASGRPPEQKVLGFLDKQTPDQIWTDLPFSTAFSNYADPLIRERAVLNISEGRR
jgi:MoaA/NifB/PqqE/SkfB family radical SAM enzyme